MANLEEHALRRDRRFLVRLGLAMIVGVAISVVLYAGLTGERVAGCAADAFGEPAPVESTTP